MRKYTTVEALAQTLDVTPRHVNNLIRRGLPVLRVGRSIRIDEAAAIAWLKKTGGQAPRESEMG